MRTPSLLSLAFVAALAPALSSQLGCGDKAPAVAHPSPQSDAQASAAAEPKRARLVVAIVLDQMPTDALLRYAVHLPKEGVLRRAIDSGLFQERVRYGYAGTNTAPGHASIHTGVPPSVHGIDRNDIYSYERKDAIKIVDDGEHEVFAREGTFAGPGRLRVDTVADLLRKEQPGAKIVSVSLKARAAVISGGKAADFATWYDDKIPGFTTSSYYAKELPAWLSEWNAAHPVSERMPVWEAENPELYEKLLGPDAAPGESSWYGFGTTFPHDVQASERPNKVFVATPSSMEYLLDMTRELAVRYELGRDEVPDLLALSVSTTDYAGHSFSVFSWEYLDVLIRTDRALAALVTELEATTDVAVLITSDHGGTPLAEATRAQGRPAGRLGSDELVAELEALADKKLGKADWIGGYIQPYIYLHESVRGTPKAAKLAALFADYATKSESVEAIYPAAEARGWSESDEWLKRDVALTIAPDADNYFVVPAEGYVAAPGKGDAGGTGHGTPWDPDREVPVLAFGAGVELQHSAEVVEQQRVAPTIAALLGLSWPLPAQALPGTGRK